MPKKSVIVVGLFAAGLVMSAEACVVTRAPGSGDASRDSLWSTPDDTSPLAFDPTAIRERFHRDHRGVQVLTAWMSEGGGTPSGDVNPKWPHRDGLKWPR